MPNGIVWNRTVFDIETVVMLNWIVWNRTIYMYKHQFGINNLQWLRCNKTKQNQYIYIYTDEIPFSNSSDRFPEFQLGVLVV